MSSPLILLLLLSVASAEFTRDAAIIPILLGKQPERALTCSAGDQATTKACLTKYFDSFGVDTAHIPPYLTFWADVETILTRFGQAGMSIVCNYLDTFNACQKGVTDKTCMSVDGFRAMYGFEDQDSSEYASDFPMRQYECDNRQVIYDNYDCLVDINHNHIDDVDACRLKMVADIAAGMSTCDTMGDYIGCMSAIYDARCGPSVKGLVCNVLEIMIKFNIGDQCNAVFPACPKP